jgi:hypothetical protein
MRAEGAVNNKKLKKKKSEIGENKRVVQKSTVKPVPL